MSPKKALSISLCLVMLASAFAFAGCGGKDVATVNGTAVTEEQLDAAFQKQLGAMGQGAIPAGAQGDTQRKQLKKNVLQSLIDQTAVEQAAKAMGVEVTDAQVQEQVDQLKKRFKSEDELNKSLQAQNMTLDSLKETIRSSLLIQQVMKKVGKAKKVTEKQALAYYNKNRNTTFRSPEQFHSRHILVKDLAIAKKVRAELTNANFAAMAKKYSTDPGSKDRGGDLGFVGKGQFVPEFEKAALAEDVGDISQPVKSNFGYHIIQLLDKKPAKAMTFAEVKSQIVSMLENQDSQADLSRWVESVRKKADIKILDETLK